MKLKEGLKELDLIDLVSPLISIDEYNSKFSDDESVVIAFFTDDREPALDLNRFIQKGTTSFIDTDVSISPSEDGFYIVFIELYRNETIYKNILEMLNAIENLTGIDTWYATFYGVDKTHEVNEENLKKFIKINK